MVRNKDLLDRLRNFWERRDFSLGTKLQKYIVFIIFALILVFSFGAGYNKLHEDGTDFNNFTYWGDGYYFSIVTMFTVGIGDFAPTSPEGKAAVSIQIVLFWSLVLLFSITVVE